MIHITLPQLCAYLDDELAESSAELVRRHLSDCLECTERFGRLEEQDELLVRILSDEPEEEFFHALSASIPLGASTDGERRTAPAFDAASAEPSAKKRGKLKPSKKPEPVAKAKAKATTTPVAKPVVIPAPPPAAAAVVTPPVVAPPAVTSAVATPPEPEPVTESAPMSEIDAEPASEPAPVAARPRAERPIPARRDRKPAPTPRRRAEDHEPAFSMRTAAIVVVVCVVVGASIAWVATRPRDAAPTPPAPTPLAAQEAPSAEAPSTGDAGPTPEELLERSAEPPPDSPEPVIDESVAATSPEPEPQEVAPEPPAPKAEARKTPAPKPRAPEPAPERLVERSPKNFVPVQTVITQTIVAPPASNDAPATPKPSRAVSQHDPAAAAVRAAKSASLEAARTKLPAAFDKSGDAWERTLPLLETAPETLATARREWAQARFQAWAADPTPARRDAAIASARQYLLYAPPGPERDQAWTWLGRLKH